LTICSFISRHSSEAQKFNVPAGKDLVSISGRLVPLLLTFPLLMKTVLIALLALACSFTTWAGAGAANPSLPDAGSSILLLGLGVTVVGALRRAFLR
jgi:hypothetical protein